MNKNVSKGVPVSSRFELIRDKMMEAYQKDDYATAMKYSIMLDQLMNEEAILKKIRPRKYAEQASHKRARSSIYEWWQSISVVADY